MSTRGTDSFLTVRTVIIEPERKRLKSLAFSVLPERVREAWVELYRIWDIKYKAPPVPFDKERIKTEKKRGRILIYLVRRLTGSPGLLTLARLFPEMRCWAIEDRKKIATSEVYGWLFVERDLEPPYQGISKAKLRRRVSRGQAQPMTLNAYIIFARFCKDIRSRYPDLRGRSLLFGSLWGKDHNFEIGARFHDDKLHTQILTKLKLEVGGARSVVM